MTTFITALSLYVLGALFFLIIVYILERSGIL